MISWTPIPKSIQREILRTATCPFQESVAYLSVSLDCDANALVSVAGYAAAWGWSRGKVSRFLNKIGAAIKYLEDTGQKQNQRGQIVMKTSSGSDAKGELLVLLNFKQLQGEKGRSDGKNRPMADRSRTSTKDTDTETKEIPVSEIISHLNSSTGKAFRPTSRATRRCILDRWEEGYCLDDFQKVIDNRVAVWGSDPKMSEFLRPETIFGGKFESYLQAACAAPKIETVTEPTQEELNRRVAAQEVAASYGFTS